MVDIENYIIAFIENDEHYVSRAANYGYSIHDYIFVLKNIYVFNFMGSKESIFIHDISKIYFYINFNLVLDPNYIKQQYAKFLIHMHLLTIVNNYEHDAISISRNHTAQYKWHCHKNIANNKKEFYLL